MISTRNFFISGTAFVVFLIVLLLLIFKDDIYVQEATVPELVILANPTVEYSIEYKETGDSYIRRAIFIEKVRNLLKFEESFETTRIEEQLPSN